MSINSAFLGHGIFTEYSLDNALNRFAAYGGGLPAVTAEEKIHRFVAALSDLKIQNVWIQIFTRRMRFDMSPAKAKTRKDLILALSNAKIAWAGWGYCAGSNTARDFDWIKSFKKDLGMQAFVVDAEPSEDTDPWEIDNVESFFGDLKNLFGVDNLALSTWPCVQVREDSVKPLLQAAEKYVSLIAPQVYWMDHPSRVHYLKLHLSRAEYPPHDPVAFVRMMIRAWKDAGFSKPLVISGQAYWDRKTKNSKTPTKDVMDAKVQAVVKHFSDWNSIVGFNWYHAGGGGNSSLLGSMSDEMVASISAADLDGKPYKAAET